METKKIEDHELVKKFANGDLESIEILINKYKNKVYTYIFMIVKDKQLTEDIFQDTFVKVISSLKKGKYQEKGIFSSWVIRIAHNLIIDHFRKSKQLKTYSSEDGEMDIFNSQKLSAETVEDTIITDQIVSDLREIIELLPQEQKEVIMLRHYGNLSFKEIADQTGVSINTALGRMRYALINLRRTIEERNLVLTR